MRADNLIPGGDPNLDELLRQSFLDLDQSNPANDQLFDTTSKDVFDKEWPMEINKQKEAQLLGKGKSARWPWYLGGAVGTGLVATAIIVFSNYNSDTDKKQIAAHDLSATTEKISPLKLNTNEKDEEQIGFHSQDEANAEKVETGNAGSSSQSQHHVSKLNNNTTKQDNLTGTNSLNGSGDGNSVTTNPVVSATSVNAGTKSALESVYGINAAQAEKLKLEVAHEKEKMIKEATLNLVRNYVQFSTSNAQGTGNAVATPYYIKNTEVSVREYKAFLNDLLMQGKLDDYEIARPKHREQLSAYGQEKDRQFFDNYFTNPFYKNNPMVFISTEGANMYCQWLQDLLRANGNTKYEFAEVDLPRAAEWVKAAQAGDKSKEYATPNGKLKESKYFGLGSGNYEVNFRGTQKANFTFIYNENPLDLKPNPDSSSIKKKRPVVKEGYIFTSEVMSNPSGMGLYNMSGNVSEMVWNENRAITAKGGNWNSSAEYLQIQWKESEFRKELEPSPYIGFRPVIKKIKK